MSVLTDIWAPDLKQLNWFFIYDEFAVENTEIDIFSALSSIILGENDFYMI